MSVDRHVLFKRHVSKCDETKVAMTLTDTWWWKYCCELCALLTLILLVLMLPAVQSVKLRVVNKFTFFIR